MASTYNLTLSNGTALTTLYALEGNGINSLSVPRQIVDINFDPSDPYLVVNDNVTTRFIDNFPFSIIEPSPFAGNYIVDPTKGSTTATLPDGQIITRISLANPPVNAGFHIIKVITGATGYWIISGPSNGNLQFYPTSSFSVTGNSLSEANTTYTVSTSTTGNEFSVIGIVTGVDGYFNIDGDQTLFFYPTNTFMAVNTGGYDKLYTIESVSLVSGNTQIQVIETITAETVITTDTIISLTVPITTIKVTETIAAEAGSNGLTHPATPSVFNFISSSAIVGTPTTPHNYLITFRIIGDHHTIFTTGSTFTSHNVMYNGSPYINAFEVLSSSYTGEYTEIIVNIIDTNPTVPVITVNSSTSWIIFPAPALPFGFIQYATSTDTSLQLVGPGSSIFNSTTTWGNAFTNNFIHMLENFANSSAPVSPLTGQLWYDNSISNLKVYSGSTWGILSRLVGTAPANSAATGHPGDYFVDDSFFYIYGATEWRRIAISSF